VIRYLDRKDGHADEKLLFHALLQDREQLFLLQATTSMDLFWFVKDPQLIWIDSDPICDALRLGIFVTIHHVLQRQDWHSQSIDSVLLGVLNGRGGVFFLNLPCKHLTDVGVEKIRFESQ
jgi:uncharacterized membrane protein YeiH